MAVTNVAQRHHGSDLVVSRLLLGLAFKAGAGDLQDSTAEFGAAGRARRPQPARVLLRRRGGDSSHTGCTGSVVSAR